MPPALASFVAADGGALASMVSRRLGGVMLWFGLVLQGGCRGGQAVFNPGSVEATAVARLGWWFFVVCGVVYVAVVVALLAALTRARHQQARPGERLSPASLRTLADDRRPLHWIIGAVAVTGCILIGFVVADFATSRALARAEGPEPLIISITGHQWWWEVEYHDALPARVVRTANELHVPVGRPLRFDLRSADVIHSFWLPNLQGKMDLIPGKPTILTMTVDRAGVYQGQCAEFCGHQHANMRLLLVAEPADAFERWLENQRQPAREPTTDAQRLGRDVFLRSTCVMCHTIRGTVANSRVGPTLTHFASRRTLAAGAAPNQRGHLAGWIIDPQQLKPGTRMPPNSLPPEQLHALLDYLESLQ